MRVNSPAHRVHVKRSEADVKSSGGASIRLNNTLCPDLSCHAARFDVTAHELAQGHGMRVARLARLLFAWGVPQVLGPTRAWPHHCFLLFSLN